MANVTVAISELTGAALDWAVAMALGWECERPQDGQFMATDGSRWLVGYRRHAPSASFHPSTNWAQGGPLIDNFDVAIIPSNYGNPNDKWSASVGAYSHYIDESLPLSICDDGMTGPTALIAACRAIVLDKLGKTVEIPQELNVWAQ